MGSFGSTGRSKSIPVGFAAVVAASVAAAAAAVAWRVLTEICYFNQCYMSSTK